MKVKATLTGLLALAVALPVLATANIFTDVDAGHPQAAIEAVQDARLMLGHPDGRFQPDRETTLAEWQTIAGRLAKNRWSRAQTAEFLAAGLQAVPEPAGARTNNPVGPVGPVESTTTTSQPVVIETTKTLPPVAVGEGHPDRNRLRDVLENAISHNIRLETEDVVLVEVRVKAPDRWLPYLRLKGQGQAIEADQTGRFQLRYLCNNLNKGEAFQFRLVYRLPEPDIGGMWIDLRVWSDTLTTPDCAALQAYKIEAQAIINAWGAGKVGLRLTETKEPYQIDSPRSGLRYQYVEPWEYRLRTTKNDCYDQNEPYQTHPGRGTYFWFEHNECLEAAAWWWVEIHWPALSETRQTERCRFGWEWKDHDKIIKCGDMTGPPVITHNQGAGLGNGWFEYDGKHYKRLNGCYNPDITACPGYDRLAREKPHIYKLGVAW